MSNNNNFNNTNCWSEQEFQQNFVNVEGQLNNEFYNQKPQEQFFNNQEVEFFDENGKLITEENFSMNQQSNQILNIKKYLLL